MRVELDAAERRTAAAKDVMSRRIDAHHHLWRYSAREYEWITPEMSAIARDFLPDDFHRELAAAGFDGSVAVQARQSITETEELLRFAEESRFIQGVVGWAPIAGKDFAEFLEKWAGCEKLKGFRHIIQDEPDDDFILRAEFNAGIDLLAGTRFVYDILVYERQLPAAIRFVDRHPNQIFVLDHIAKPRIPEQAMEPWRSNLLELAKRENVYCKLSGMVTEADWRNWSSGELRPYCDVVLEAFGPARLMFGSDWPVCLLASPYQRWLDTAAELLDRLSAYEKDLIFGGVASTVYSLQSE